MPLLEQRVQDKSSNVIIKRKVSVKNPDTIVNRGDVKILFHNEPIHCVAGHLVAQEGHL